MKCFSLFSGIGGFDLAARNTNNEIVGACEIDKHARQVYERHFPRVRIWEDATKLNPEELPDFDILCAGFPCQAFSIAGRRLGFEESRGTLFFEIARIARQKRPRYLLLENVVGLLSHDNGRTFAEILAALDEIGYDVEWQVLNSKYFVPQNRERVFIIGHLRGETTRKIFPIGESETISNQKRQGEQEISQGVRCEISCIDSRYGALRNSGETYIMTVLPDISLENRVYSTDGITPSLRTRAKMITVPVSTANTKKNGRFFKTNGEATFTISTSCDNGVFDGHDVRRLTPLECERLQGFPDDWTKELTDTNRYKCLGNAITVPVVQYIFECLTLDRSG